MTCDFQQYGILTSVDLDEPVPQELVTNFFYEKVGVCICKQAYFSYSKGL